MSNENPVDELFQTLLILERNETDNEATGKLENASLHPQNLGLFDEVLPLLRSPKQLTIISRYIEKLFDKRGMLLSFPKLQQHMDQIC